MTKQQMKAAMELAKIVLPSETHQDILLRKLSSEMQFSLITIACTGFLHGCKLWSTDSSVLLDASCPSSLREQIIQKHNDLITRIEQLQNSMSEGFNQ